MSALCISKAIKLYRLLRYVLPGETDGTVLTYVGQIVYNIRVTNQHKIYLEALALMQGTDMDTIIATYTPEESLLEFTRGLEENQILALKDYCEKVGI